MAILDGTMYTCIQIRQHHAKDSGIEVRSQKKTCLPLKILVVQSNRWVGHEMSGHLLGAPPMNDRNFRHAEIVRALKMHVLAFFRSYSHTLSDFLPSNLCYS
jgi:hypothetical protein